MKASETEPFPSRTMSQSGKNYVEFECNCTSLFGDFDRRFFGEFRCSTGDGWPQRIRSFCEGYAEPGNLRNTDRPDRLKVTTSFGEVAIPMAKIDGIKMHADGNDSSVIAFKNGDLVTGKVELETIKLKTDWGTAHVNTSQIEQITSERSARFFSDSSGAGAKSWRFQKTPPARAVSPSPAGLGFGGRG